MLRQDRLWVPARGASVLGPLVQRLRISPARLVDHRRCDRRPVPSQKVCVFFLEQLVGGKEVLDLPEPVTRSLSWRAVGTSRAIRQSGATLRSKTSQPFEPSLSTDTKLTAKLSNRMDATPRRLNKALTRFQ